MIILNKIVSTGRGTLHYAVKLVPIEVKRTDVMAYVPSNLSEFNYRIGDFKLVENPTKVLVNSKWIYVSETIEQISDLMKKVPK